MSQQEPPPAAANPPRGGYIPSLDGIRALSIAIVFAAHMGFGDIVPGGFGVTIFFLLSGYLITTLLRAEYARHGRISLGDFYLRRALRILPPLYIVLALAALLLRLAWGDVPFPTAGTVAQALQVSNYFLIYNKADDIILPGTGVFWSLAVEEHFYLVFPLLYIAMCARGLPAARQATVLLGLCAAALLWRCVLFIGWRVDWLRVYYGTDTRFDSILFGCALAVIANPVFDDPLYRRMLRWMRWLLPLCVLVLAGTVLVRSEQFRETLRYTLQGLALIPLFVAAIHYQDSPLVRLLNLRWVRFIGVLSYVLYLCHGVFLETVAWTLRAGPLVDGVVALALAIGFATLVHYAVEKPLARVRKRLAHSG